MSVIGDGFEGHTVTHLLGRWGDGDRAAAEAVMPLVYNELRQIARRYFRNERPNHTLQATAVVHEVYMALEQRMDIEWQDRRHFYGMAACLMRRALVDHARRLGFAKRGAGLQRVQLGNADLPSTRPESLIALDDALRDLARVDPRKALIVELRFFGGLTVDEIAQCLGSSPRSVAREWRRAKAVLYRALDKEDSNAL